MVTLGALHASQTFPKGFPDRTPLIPYSNAPPPEPETSSSFWPVPVRGKTTTLAGRFVHLVRQGVDRRRILALTFTKKAADEMKSRIATALDLPSAADMSVAIFHGFSFRHLRRARWYANWFAGAD
jgi:hypothetical protein